MPESHERASPQYLSTCGGSLLPRLPAADQILDHAAHQVDLGGGPLAALEHHRDRPDQAGAALLGAEEVDRVELAHEVVDQARDLGLGRRRASRAAAAAGAAAGSRRDQA